MTLLDHLVQRIQSDGPITVADYMADCLLHPTQGYYATRDPFGADGDFVTAPEISQMFGELLGLSLAQCWLDHGRPSAFTLAELGPGRGTLMADALRACAAVPGFLDAVDIVLLEASPKLRTLQAETLPDARWIEHVGDLPQAPLFLVANEFFDALPIRQFQRGDTGWSERLIGLSDTGQLCFGLGAEVDQPALAHRLEDTRPGDIVESCAAASPIVHEIASRIAQHGGAALLIDYGDWRALGDTFQAVQAHAVADPLSMPGHADLTAHVDFETLAITAQTAKAAYTRLTPQGVFLERLGITARAQTLAKNSTGEAAENLISAHRRLTHPDEMGNLFKVLGIYSPDQSPPPGLNA